MKRNLISIAVILLLCLSLCSCSKSAEESTTEPYMEIESVNEISYMADFQGIKVMSACNADGVAAVVILNDTDKTLQYIKFTETFPDGTVYSYSASTVPSGRTCTVLEDNSGAYIGFDGTAPQWQAVNVAFFTEEPSAYSDKLEYVGSDGILTVKNISDEDIVDNIVIYYKDYVDSQFTSGVTYRVTVSGGLKSGEMTQVQAQHYVSDKSIIMFTQFVSAEVG